MKLGVLDSDWRPSKKLYLMLSQRFAVLDYDNVKNDVVPFIPNPRVLDVWNKEFFQSITKEMLATI